MSLPSATSPMPDCQMPPRPALAEPFIDVPPLGVVQKIAFCASVSAAYAKIQPWYGSSSQWLANAM